MSADFVSEVRTVDSVKRAVVAIQKEDGDAPAHHQADDLYLGILKAIANGRAENPQAMAKEAVEVEHFAFERWYE